MTTWPAWGASRWPWLRRAAPLYDDNRVNRAWGIPLLIMRQGMPELLDVAPAELQKLRRPSKQELKEDLQSYQELTGKPDPTDKAVQQAVEEKLRSMGMYASPLALGGLSERFAAQLAGRSQEGIPLAEKQKPRDLAGRISARVNMRAGALQEYVEQYTRLELPAETYGHIAASLNAGKHIILTGAHGTAKTTLARAICEFACGWRLVADPSPGGLVYRVDPKTNKKIVLKTGAEYANHYVLATATADWTTFDTIGGYMPDQSQALQFRPGLFLEAIRLGDWLIIDEINRAEIDKAIGPLFTVLSGQGVDLPYKVNAKDVRILPPNENRPKTEPSPSAWWVPADADEDGYDYVIHPNWRIIGTMNVYDKSTLFQLSFAFMRRFAFIDVDLPSDAKYAGLIQRWLDEYVDTPPAAPGGELAAAPLGLSPAVAGAVQPAPAPPDCASLILLLRHLLWHQQHPQTPLYAELPDPHMDKNPLMSRRAVGPAIVRDMIAYIGNRCQDYQLETAGVAGAEQVDQKLCGYLGEAFAVYIVPQLDGLDYPGIKEIYQHLEGYIFLKNSYKDQILSRIRMLYPHIQNWGEKQNPAGL